MLENIKSPISCYKEKFSINTRKKIIIYITIAVVYLLVVFIWGITMNPEKYGVNYSNKFISPCSNHLFGTDFMGRDMFYRCIKGLSNSILIGIVASLISSVIALIFGVSSALIGGIYDRVINWCIDACMGMPHLILLILISFMLGKGGKGVAIAVAVTHWTSLTRVLRAEIKQIQTSDYVKLSERLGKSKIWIATKHILPLIVSQIIVGVILMFPHAIMHEAAITFLGFGLPPHEPAIGVILSESMHYLSSGYWWLAFYPGLSLLIVVLLFDLIGENVEKLLNPETAQE